MRGRWSWDFQETKLVIAKRDDLSYRVTRVSKHYKGSRFRHGKYQ